MDKIELERERRRQRRIERLRTSDPVCIVCGYDDNRCLERHHIAGRAYDDETCIICRNCHRKLSDDQRDHPTPDARTLGEEERIGRFLLGLSNLLSLLAERLWAFGSHLLEPGRDDDPRDGA